MEGPRASAASTAAPPTDPTNVVPAPPKRSRKVRIPSSEDAPTSGAAENRTPLGATQAPAPASTFTAAFSPRRLGDPGIDSGQSERGERSVSAPVSSGQAMPVEATSPLAPPAADSVAATTIDVQAASDSPLVQGIETEEPSLAEENESPQFLAAPHGLGSAVVDDLDDDGPFLHLGDAPDNPLIADLVALNDTRVRLANAIATAADSGAIPLGTVSEYIAAGAEAQALFMVRVANLGRKSAAELDALVARAYRQMNAGAHRAPAGPPMSANAIRKATAAFFVGRETERVFAHYVMPARFHNAIFLAGWLGIPFADLLLDYPARSAALAAQPNVGATSIAAGQDVITTLVTEELERRGFPSAAISAVIATLLQGRDPSVVERQRVTTAFTNLIQDGRAGGGGTASGADRMSASDVIPLTCAELVVLTAGLFGELQLNALVQPYVPPARLENVLRDSGWASDRIADIFEDFSGRERLLLRRPNMGRVSLVAWRKITEAILVKQLRGRGFDLGQVADLVKLILHDAELDWRARQALTEQFNRLNQTSSAVLDEGISIVRSPEEAQAPSEPLLDPQTLLAPMVEALEARSREIIERRYGFAGERETLEQVSRTYGVTRERIRQIESKALRRLRMQLEDPLSSSILLHGASVWETLATARLVLLSEMGRRRRDLSPWFELALDVLKMDLTAWLNAFAQPLGQGWVEPGYDLERLESVRARLLPLIARHTGPRVLTGLIPDVSQDDVVSAALLEGQTIYGDYVVRERPRARTKRALRLHSLLGELGAPTDVNAALVNYHLRWPDDLCGSRDAEIVMESHPGLFIEVHEGFWSALGPAGRVPAAASFIAASDETDAPAEPESTPSAPEEVTVREAIAAELHRTGPLRISELIERAPAYLPQGRSPNSVGPILLGAKDLFARPLPGIYALHHQVPSANDVLRLKPGFLFEDRQVRTYVMARRAGEPFGGYALWTPEVEYLWCVWAKRNADTPLLEALLSVAEPGRWPAVDGVDDWLALKAARGRFALQQEPREDVFVLPDLEYLLSAAKFIKHAGWLSWVTANRIMFRRPIDHNASGLMAILVALDLLEQGAADWQAAHAPGAALDAVLGDLEAERMSTGVLTWSSPLGQRLRDRALSAEFASGWVKAARIRTLVGENGASNSKAEVFAQAAPAPISFLDQLLADQSARHEAIRLHAVLAELSVGSEEPS